MELENKISNEVDPFWFNHFKILYNQDRLVEFFPSNSMTNNEKLNAMLRLSIYVSAILFLYHKNLNVLLIPLFVALVTLYVFKFNNVQEEEEKVEGFATHDCQMPTDDNPFMNTLVSDVGMYKEKKEACLLESVADKVEEKFNKGLFKDVGDLYDKSNGQRQYYTMPETKEYGIKSGDTVKLANWLYNTGESTCKENTASCTNSFAFYNNDLRHSPHLLVEKK